MPSFDISMETDLQEVDNALNQARKEIAQRFDFRGSKSEIEWDKAEAISLLSEEDKIDALLDVVKSKLIKRGVSIRNMEIEGSAPAADGLMRQAITLKTAIPKETAKKIVKEIKQAKMKVQAQIQDDQVRVTGKKRDDLQQVITLIKGAKLDYDFQFGNFRN